MPKASRVGREEGLGKGLCPYSIIGILFLEMLHFGAFYTLLNKI